ncbi:MAG TPA: Calx-beta domain-containing protein [Kiritimatiellia bacterium]|nr:Calx-beta domain-containing protein [Kiritimatiellia bacterium]HMP34762.1 Calx-beta domain-containing protein [Kiritimatiellia bacterium]
MKQRMPVYGVKMRVFAGLVAVLGAVSASDAQTSVQSFGTGSGTNSTTTGSTTLIPNPSSGTTYARGGATAPAAPIILTTNNNPLGTANTYVRAVASSSTSVSKFSPIVGYAGSPEFYTSFKVLFGDASAGTTAASGSWTFWTGAGATFVNNNDFTGTDVFTGLRFTYAASGVINMTFRNGGAFNNTGLSPASLSQGTVYTIEVVGNNKASGTINYTYNGNAQSVAVQTWDLYVNGSLVGDDLARGGIAAGNNVTSLTFIGISSVGNVANIFVDDVVAYAAVPASIGTAPPSVATVAASATNTTTATVGGNVTADGGSAVTNRGVVYKTTAGVTIADNKTAQGSGTGSYSVNLSSLSVNQQYYFRAYADNSAGSALGSELSFWTLANTPSAPTVNNPTPATLDVAINANGNPSSTEFAIQDVGSGQYVQGSGALGGSPVWQTASAWGTRTVTGLAPETTYQFQVKARNGENVETAFSATGSGTTDAGAPTPTPPSVSTPTAAAVAITTATLGGTIDSTNNAPVTERGVFWHTTSGFTPPGTGTKVNQTGTFGNGAFTVSAVGLPSGSTMYFVAYASNTAGAAYSSESSFLTIPAAPGIAAATDVTNITFTANWSASTGATNYLLDVATAANFSALVPGFNARVMGLVTSSGVTGLSPNVTYYYRVRAQNETGTSGNSATTTVTTVTMLASITTTPVSAITTISASSGGNITDNGGASVTQRGVAWNTSGSPTTGDSTTSDGTGSGLFTSSLTGLVPGQTYYVRAYAVNSVGTAYGNEQTFSAACFGSGPAGLYANPTNTTSFTANWNALAGATGYRIDVGTTAGIGGSGPATNLAFRETLGSVGGTTTIASHESANGFDNDAYLMNAGGAANPADLRATSVSSGYADPAGNAASGGANLFFTSTSGEYGFAIHGITTDGNGFQRLGFGYRKESGSVNATFTLGWSTNGGTTWNSIAVSNLPAAGAAANWYYVSNLAFNAGAATTNLSIRWVKSGTASMRVDDIVLQHVTSGGADSYVAGYSNLAVAGTSVAVTGLAENTVYYYRVRAEGASGCVSPNSATESVTTAANSAIANFATASDTAAESVGTVVIPVTLNTSADATVQVARASGSTADEGDFTFATTNIVFTAGGPTTSNVVINVIDDSIVEPSESLVVQLVGGANIIAGSATNFVLTITDNEPSVQFTASAASVSEGSVSYTVTVYKASALNNVSGQVTLGGTAVLDTDYSINTTAFTLNGGTTSSTFIITITDDPDVEVAETVVLTLDAISGASTGTPATFTLTLENNDCAVANTIAFQGFEGDFCDTWAITGGVSRISTLTGATDTPANARIRTGANSWQVSNATATLDLGPVSLIGYNAATVTVRLSSTSFTAGNGADLADSVKIYVSLNEATYSATPDVQINGAADNNARYSYAAATNIASTTAGTPITVNSITNQNGDANYSTAQIIIPDGYASVRLRIIANNNANEIWNIDDIQLSGVAGAYVDTAPPSITGFDIRATNDQIIGSGFVITGSVLETYSGIVSDANTPYVFIRAPDGSFIETSNTFDTAPVNGANVPSTLLESVAAVSPAGIVLGTYTAVVGAVDGAGNGTTSNYTFTVVDDDLFPPILQGFAVDGQVFLSGSFPNGIVITGQARDAVSGLLAITNAPAIAPNINLYSPSGVQLLTNAVFYVGPSTNGAYQNTFFFGSLVYTSPASLYTEFGTYTAVVTVTDADMDRPGDSLTTTTSLVFSVSGATVRFGDNFSIIGENGGSTSIAVVVSSPMDTTVRVAIAGSAAPGDFTTTGTNLVFSSSGSVTQFFTVTAVDDGAFEGDETVVLTLGTDPGLSVGNPNQHTVRIADDECPSLIAFQGFEAGACDTWSITNSVTGSTATGTNDTPAQSRIRSGLRSWQVNNGTATLELGPVSLAGYQSVTATVRIAASSTTGGGLDTTDNVRLFVSLNNAAYSGTPDIQINGFGNTNWTYEATRFAATTAGVAVTASADPNGVATAIIVIPDGFATVRMRIVALNNAADEVWNIDDIQLAGVAGAADSDGPVFAGISLAGRTTNDAAMAAGFAVTGLVSDTQSGVLSDGNTPYYFILNNLGVAVVASNGFDTAPVNGGALTPTRIADTFAGVVPANLSLGVYTIVVGAADAALTPNVTTTNYTFTVADDDAAAPVLSGFTLGGQTFPLGGFDSGILVTGRVQDAGSGVYGTGADAALAPRINLFSPSGVQVLTNVVFTNGPTANGSALAAASNLAYTISAAAITEQGIYTARVSVTDFDTDRDNDSLTTTSNLVFSVTQPTVQFLTSASSISEGGSFTNIFISISASVDATVQVAVAGTALPDVDYTTSTTNIVFVAGGSRTNAIVIYPIEDILDEGAETIELTLTNAYGLVILGAISTNVVTITDNDGPQSIWFQGFENSVADTWGISAGNAQSSTATGSADTPASQRIRTGARSWQNINGSNTLDLANVSVLGYNSMTATVHLSSTAGTSGNGAEVTDMVRVYVALNGAAFGATPDITVQGNSNARWAYNASGVASTTAGTPITVQPAGGGNRTTDGYATLQIAVPDGTTSIRLRVIANNNDGDERWNVDDISLSGTALNTDLGVSIAGTPEPATVGANLTYTIAVTNHGPNILGVAYVTNTLDSTLSYVSSSSGGAHSSGRIVWTITGLEAGATTNLTVTAQPSVPGAVTSTVRVAMGAGNDLDPSDNVATTTNTVACPALAAPTLLAETAVNTTTFQANWSSVAGASGYRFDLSLNNNFSSFVAGNEDVAVAGLSRQISGLTPGQTYYYRVRATVGTGCTGGNSLTNSITLPATSDVVIEQVPAGGASTSVTWTATVGARYDIYYSDSDAGGNMTWQLVQSGVQATTDPMSYPVTEDDKRYFKVVVIGATPSPVADASVWSVYKPTIPSGYSMLSAPVDYADLSLSGTFGDELKAGLANGSRLYFVEPNGSFTTITLSGGNWDTPYTPSEGQGFFIENQGGSYAPRFSGPVGNSGTTTITVNGDAGGRWNILGLSQGKTRTFAQTFPNGNSAVYNGTPPTANWNQNSADVIAIDVGGGVFRRIFRAGDGTWRDASTLAAPNFTFPPGAAVYYQRRGSNMNISF